MTPHRTLHRAARQALLPAVLLPAAALLAGCAGAGTGSLDAQSATPSPTCLVHQTNQPADRYTAGANSDTRSVLEMMRYYTANGTKAYCDGKPATSTDRRWTELYTDLGGDPVHVPRPDRTP
ncbi:hypothetical protein OH807_40160 [Kitasatospora sp. NBC_01560]|uniref:hypothetical protein n=1 Tax=Kitasatospora sp. NBC_01560 TaxID=2975965 RepID=UPI00386DCEB4